mgnify:CR=1 FL=1
MSDIIYELRRFFSTNDATVGILLRNGKFMCWTLEDEYREEKVDGETRVPCGTYNLGLRKDGKMTKRYDAKYKDIDHSGMLCLYNNPNWVASNSGISFQYCYFHIGNKDDHTEGCVLVGTTPVVVGSMTEISGSEAAYKKLYAIMAEDIESDLSVELVIKEYDR